MKRLKGIRVIPETENGRIALERSFTQEGTQKEMAITKAFWVFERDEAGVTFLFRRAGLAAVAFSRGMTPGRLRRHYEKNIETLEVEFHKMMRGCGAMNDDYRLEEVWR